ncbi:hypothetical protein Gotri_024228 [Gossypium trilobum]|uniref:Uncharacterized protein n=1 Tax=Gossypium trilobum TaxID=34281 RepID=A0A7J9DLG9_9ROSI|nr:hypothetical protein [Gossypium trilobum]
MSAAGQHILVYPFPTSGHFIPFLDLTHRLLNRRLTVTVLVTPNNLHLLDPLLTRHASSSLHHLLLPDMDPLPAPNLPARLRRLRDLHYPALLQWFQSLTSPPVAIFSDFFLGWTQSLASELGLRRIVFSPSSSFSYSLNMSLCRESLRIDDPQAENQTLSFPDIPNSPKYPAYQINSIYRTYKDADPDKEFYRRNWLQNLESWGVVFNTFSDLEAIYIDHLKKEIMGHDRIWAVGPVLGDDGLDTTNRGGSSSVPFQELVAWLDSRDDNSVVYVSFGSHYVLTLKQMDVVASGLEERIAAGVVMLTWPMGADQFTNTKLLVDECGVGIRVGESTQNIPESSTLARMLVESLDGSRAERSQAKMLSEEALNAVNGGTSDNDLGSLVKAINEIKPSTGSNKI